jgi:hypothetical protein
VLHRIPFSSDETATEAVKEPSDLLVPPSGCNSTSQDVESSPVSTSSNDNTPLPSASPQASPSTVPADSGEPHARKMGKLYIYVIGISYHKELLYVGASCICCNTSRRKIVTIWLITYLK